MVFALLNYNALKQGVLLWIFLNCPLPPPPSSEDASVKTVTEQKIKERTYAQWLDSEAGWGWGRAGWECGGLSRRQF